MLVWQRPATDADAAFVAAIFDRVLDEVEQHLLQAVGVRLRAQLVAQLVFNRRLFLRRAGLQIGDGPFDARAHLVIALRERGTFAGERFLALAQCAILFLESIDGDEKFFDAAFEQRDFRGEALLVVVCHGAGL